MGTFSSLSKTFILMVCLLALTACGGQPKTPQSVTDTFWKAVIKNDQDGAKELTTPVSAHFLASLHNETSQLKSVELSEPVVTENTAVVETILHGKTEDGEDVAYPTTTYLVKYDDAWRVEAEQTVGMLTSNNPVEDVLAELGQTFSMLGKQLSDALDQGLQGFSESMEETLPQINSQLEELQESDKFKNMGSQLGKVLGQGLSDFTAELSDGLEELNKEVEKAAAEIDAAKQEAE